MFEPNCYLRCADGDVVLAAVAQPLWERLVDLLGSPAWASEPRFGDPRSRAVHWAELHARLGAWALGLRCAELVEATQALGLPSFRTFELGEVVAGDHVGATGSVRTTRGKVFPADPIVVDGDRRPPAEDGGAGDLPRAPLAEIRVLDLGQYVAGPFASQTLAALGAEVVLVESSRRPLSRSFGPYAGDPHPDRSAMFNLVNRGKRSVTVDLSTPAGRRTLEALVQTADVVVENFGRESGPDLREPAPAARRSHPRLDQRLRAGRAVGWLRRVP
jgi:crotonobetainyl-CoA:carnitine CoA-transferase CaiB-like acyl-CoA transferase